MRALNGSCTLHAARAVAVAEQPWLDPKPAESLNVTNPAILRCFVIALTLHVCSASAEPIARFTSGEVRVPLVELYTSEGCSSCPPADRFFSELAADAGLWTKFVPVAFHVTYWDYLGWRDGFGHREHDERHRTTAERDDAGVYTPGVFHDGREWRAWRTHSPATVPLAHPQRAGVLAIETRNGQLSATYTPTIAVDQPRLSVTWLQNNRVTSVARGENAGRQLRHDFVAARIVTTPLVQRGGSWVTEPALRVPDGVKADAVAAWVTNSDDAMLQAVGGWLPARPGGVLE